MSTSDEVLEILTMLATAYPRFKLEEQTAEVYYRLLRDIPTDQLRAAAVQCASGGDFFPSVHELRQAVSEIHRQAHHIPSAFEAWAELSRAGTGEYKRVAEDNGQYYIETTHVQFSHDLVRRVAEMLGWPQSFPGENQAADRAHFYKTYEQVLAEILADDIQLPEVREFIESSRLELLGGGHGRQSSQIESIGAVAGRMAQLKQS
jgi:hypothetical protein